MRTRVSLSWVLMFWIGLQLIATSRVLAGGLVYVALGDSYTAGTGVDPDHAWPFQLEQSLKSRGIPISETHNLAVAGSDIEAVIRDQLPRLKNTHPDFITLQIGVNDWVRSTGFRRFRNKLKWLLMELSALSQPTPKILVVSLPDFSCAPSVKRFGYGKSAENGMKRFNRAIRELALAHSLPFANIFEISRESCAGSENFSPDGMHPSKDQYQAWVDKILPDALELLSQVEK